MVNKGDFVKYRREIDGLRSIAVMAVVMFHFGLSGLQGGFVGVDIFFVISGFLIGGILWGELTKSGTVSLSRFYARRIRRLAPAYVVMALVTFGVAWSVLLPFEFREFGKGLIAATLYLANVLFYRQAGYFDSGVEEKVFLHTWSLSVEEQFYIVLPFLFLLLVRNRRLMIGALVALFCVSLAAGIIMTPTNQTAAFYLFPTRAWELLAGVLLAIYGRESGTAWRFNALLSWVGIGLILASITMIVPERGFPGYQAIFPVFGTVLIVLNGRHSNMVNRVLASRGPVALGLISYSLYLWHWPVLVLSRYVRNGYAGILEIGFWIGVSMGLAWLSWRFVERPFRGRDAPSVAKVFGGAAAASFVLLMLGGGVFLSNGIPARFSPEVRVHIDASADFLQDFSRCYVPREGPLAGIDVCPIGPEGAPEVLIWGDSHLRAFYEGVAQVAREQNVAGLVIWHAGCPPLFGVQKTESAATPAQDIACTRANSIVESALKQMPSLKKVLLVGRWAYYAQGRGIGADFDNEITLSGKAYDEAIHDSLEVLTDRFDEVFVLRQAPEIPLYASKDVARLLVHGGKMPKNGIDELITFPEEGLRARFAAADAPFRDFAATNMTVLDPWPMICSGGVCSAIKDGKGMYFDNNHVTNTAARQMRDIFVPVFSTKENDAEGNDD